jgi:hypothetical protein
LCSSETGDPFDPLSAPAVALHSPSYKSAVASEEEEEEVGEEGECQKADLPEAMDEATSGFLDKVNSGTINSAQFMPAIVDLPEKVKKKRPRKPKEATAPLPVVKKKRKRELDDSSDDSYDDDAEYRPTAAKRSRQKSTKKTIASSRTTRGAGKRPRRTNARRESLFGCRYCDFKTETIGICHQL